jgi:hypothetical protein
MDTPDVSLHTLQQLWQLPPSGSARASYSCECERPLPRVRAERKGAAATYCDRCGRPIRPTL